MKKLLLAAALVCAAHVSNANAGLLLEPYLGYGMGSSKNGTGTNDDTGLEYGARVAFETMGFFVGGEYMGGSVKSKDKTGGKTYTLTPTNMGLAVGYQFPVLVRAYATYFFTADSKVDTNPAVTYKGSAMKIGVGYTGFPIIAINLEYISTTFTKGEVGGVSGTLSNKITGNLIALSVSAPFTF